MIAKEVHATQRGSILVFVLVFAIVVSGAAAALIAESNYGLRLRAYENKLHRTLQDVFSGLEVAKNAIRTADYDADDHNLALWTIDSTDDDIPGAEPLIDNGRARVTVSYLGGSWYELHAKAPPDPASDELAKEVKLRVRERDFFSRYGLLIENGSVNIADTTDYRGRVHVNKNIVFKDMVAGVGAQVYGFMSSTLPFTFNGGAALETKFYQGYADNLGKDGWIKLPDPKALEEYREDTGAHGPQSTSLWSAGTGGNEKELRRGPGGYSVTGNVYTCIELIYDRDTRTQYVKFTIKDTSGSTLFSSTFTSDYIMPDPALIHVEKDIRDLRGEVRGGLTVVSETADVRISADIYYVDEKGRHPMAFDPDNTANDNYLPNPDYDGNAVLGIIAYRDVLYTGSQDDENLEINGVLMAVTGQVKWGGSGDKGHLRVFGARISNGQTYRSSGRSSGYNDSGVYYYDDNLHVTPPPNFLPLDKPLFIGFEMVK